jgi:pimeloyl-ACP methyl ester carboxylesterase
VTTSAGFAAARTQAQGYTTDCEQALGDKLGDFNTMNTVRDMDLIRQAVGDARLNYLGFSYGTVLGSQYAHMFPDKVRVAVLDGAVDPSVNSITSFGDQMKGFEQAFDQFAANCLTVSPCKSLGNPRQAAYTIFANVQKNPLDTGTSRPLTWSLAELGVLEALYSQQSWPTLASAMISALQGDGSGLLTLADEYAQRNDDGTYSNLMDANMVIDCNDSDVNPTDAQIQQTAAQWITDDPRFGKWSAASLFDCQNWPAKQDPPPSPTAPTSAPILVVGNTHDPATPYQGAKNLTAVLGSAELLTWNGEGHTSYLSGNQCVDDYVNAYLLTAKLPPQHTVCPA